MNDQNLLLDKEFQSHDHEHDEVLLKPDKLKVLNLEPEKYPGGIAIWGALPAVFNSSACPDDEDGVHVHARMEVGGPKQIDETFDIVRININSENGTTQTFDVNGSATANYNISTILKKKLKYLICPTCKNVHSDIGVNAVSYHLLHTCEHCGQCFLDTEPSISNSVMLLKEICGDVLQDRVILDPVDRKINVKKNTFKGGMQMWGSNPAVLWTSPKFEEGGIHFHGFQTNNKMPTVDETYGSLTIDNILLDPEMVRHLMVQNALLYLKTYLTSLTCPNCNGHHFDTFDNAVNPHLLHICEHCNSEFDSPNGLPCVSNPLIKILTSFQ